jgi:general secretion pathway protein F
MSWHARTIFYHQLLLLAKTGIPASEAVALAGTSSPAPYRGWAGALADGCRRGQPLAVGLRACGERPLVVALIDAGEKSGRLPDVCREIVDFYQLAVDLRRMVIGRSIYPMLLLHFAMVVLPFTQWLVSGWPAWLMLAFPLAFWIGILLAVILFTLLRRTGLLAAIALLPGARGLTMPLAVHNSLLVVNAGLEAGMLLPAALRLAAGSCGNAIISDRIRVQADAVERGRTPDLTATVQALDFPATYVALVRTGEIGGTLDEALRQAAAIARESFHSRVTWTTRVILGSVYFLVLLTVAAAILAVFYQIYHRPMMEVMQQMP